MGRDATEGHGIKKLLGKSVLTWHHTSEDATVKSKISSAVLNIKFA
jgi:hypothetical protein